MSDQIFEVAGVKSYGSDRVLIAFSILLAGNSSPATISGITGLGNLLASATGSATGKCAVVMNDGYNFNAVLYASAVLEDASSSDGGYATIGNFANEGTASPLSFQIATWAAGGAATAFSRRCFVVLILRNTNATASAGVP